MPSSVRWTFGSGVGTTKPAIKVRRSFAISSAASRTRSSSPRTNACTIATCGRSGTDVDAVDACQCSSDLPRLPNERRHAWQHLVEPERLPMGRAFRPCRCRWDAPAGRADANTRAPRARPGGTEDGTRRSSTPLLSHQIRSAICCAMAPLGKIAAASLRGARRRVLRGACRSRGHRRRPAAHPLARRGRGTSPPDRAAPPTRRRSARMARQSARVHVAPRREPTIEPWTSRRARSTQDRSRTRRRAR